MAGVHHAAQGLCACAGASPPARLALLKRRLSLSEIARMRGQFRDAVVQRLAAWWRKGAEGPIVSRAPGEAEADPAAPLGEIVTEGAAGPRLPH